MEELIIYRRRAFYLSAVFCAAAIVLFRLLVPRLFPCSVVGPFIGILDAIFATLIGTVAVTSLVLILTPPPIGRAVIDVVVPFKIKAMLESALQGVNEWWYRGHTGRHFRSVTLPGLATQSRSTNIHKRAVIQILDPTDQVACEYYAKYRNSLRSAAPDSPWDAQRVRCELCATVISAYIWKAKEQLLDVEIGLLAHVSLFRVDLASSLALVTKEDPREPALRFDNGTFFYEAYKEDLRLSYEQARIITLPMGMPPRSFDEMSNSNVRNLLIALSIDHPELDHASVLEIIRLTREARNPYA